MVDPDVVRRRLAELDDRLHRLRVITAEGRGRYLAERELQARAERHLQVALQCMIDLSLHVLADDHGETPEEYGAALTALAHHDVIATALADRLADAARLRNLLVHLYLGVDQGRLWDALTRLADLDEFAAAMIRYLER